MYLIYRLHRQYSSYFYKRVQIACGDTTLTYRCRFQAIRCTVGKLMFVWPIKVDTTPLCRTTGMHKLLFSSSNRKEKALNISFLIIGLFCHWFWDIFIVGTHQCWTNTFWFLWCTQSLKLHAVRGNSHTNRTSVDRGGHWFTLSPLYRPVPPSGLPL